MGTTRESGAQQPAEAQRSPGKKPYTKPTLRFLGTVRDLTQTGISGNPK